MEHRAVYDLAEQVHKALKKLASDGDVCFDVDLCCACALGSYILFRGIKKYQEPATFVVGQYFKRPDWGDDHCWVIWNNQIIDVTATQFGHAGVVIATEKDKRFKPRLKNLPAIKEVNSTWPDEQSPKSYSWHWGKSLTVKERL